jgi:NTP pyrophosphatase (non-canonical NTP hydrolase)
MSDETKQLQEAVKETSRDHPLPRCIHGKAFTDHSGEWLEMPCGCKFPKDWEHNPKRAEAAGQPPAQPTQVCPGEDARECGELAGQPGSQPGPDCDEAAKHAYSDATTPGFFEPKCSKHRAAHLGAPEPSQGTNARMTLKEMQTEIIANRTRRGWSSATDIHKTIHGLAEELGEFVKGVKHGDSTEMVDALGDLMIFALGGLEILGADAQSVLDTIIENNKARTHNGHH